MDSQARLFLARIHRIPILFSKYSEVSMDMAPNTYQIHLLILFASIILSRSRAKASQKQRFAETADGADIPSSGSSGSSVFASLSQWYDHARTVWQTLSMCGTDLLQFRTMRRAGSYGKSMEKLFVYVTTREALGECYSCG